MLSFDLQQDYVGFLLAISEAVAGRNIDENMEDCTPAIQATLAMLDKLYKWAEEVRPVEQPQRFGNKAYRDWHKQLTDSATSLLAPILRDKAEEHVEELSAYLLDSFGNATRIDYGTGHEMAFVLFLCGLFKVKVYEDSAENRSSVGLAVFARYMSLVRFLQRRYQMEPAGSQGVWALDDYQFVPFIWGAAQLNSATVRVKPKAIADYEIAAIMSKKNHLFACIEYISQVKTGPFAEHSNQLWNVSGVPNWAKVHQGLVKMYRAEVLSKFPVIQHVLFGSIFTLAESASPPPPVTVGPAQQPTGKGTSALLKGKGSAVYSKANFGLVSTRVGSMQECAALGFRATALEHVAVAQAVAVN